MRCFLAILLLFAVSALAVANENTDDGPSGYPPKTGMPSDDEDIAEESGSGNYLDEEEDVESTTKMVKLYETTDNVPEEEMEKSEDEVPKVPVGRDFKDVEVIMVEEKIEVVDLRKEIIEEPKDESTPESKVLETYSVFESAHFVTAVVVGGCVGLLFAIILIMLLLYRMRKKDEGSYALEDTKKLGAPPAYQYTQGQEYYA